MPATTDAHPEKDQLVAFGLGKLDPAEASQIEQHLEACQDCCSTILNLQDDTFVGLVRVSQPASAAPDQSGVTLAVPAGSGAAQPAVAELPAVLKAHDRYEIQELIGRGGMGDVYQAQHKLMNRQVALKVIKPQLVRNEAAVQRFRREVQAAASLHHKHIVTAYDAEQAGELHFLVMEFVDGVNLDEVIRQRGPLPVAEACDYIRQAAEGLQHAHELGMVHRDIKPHNLMVTKSGEVKILDFGLAGFATEVAEEEIRADNTQSAVETAAALHQLTQMGTMMGTPDYIAPEQAANAHSADIRADIYSLGCTLFTLLAGKAPFADGSVLDKIKAHSQQEPPPISQFRSDVPAEVEAILRKMLVKDPAERYQTPAEVATAMAACQSPSAKKPLVQASPKRIRPRAALLTALAMLFVGMTAAVVYYVQTDYGVVRVEVADESLEIKLAGNTITAQNDDQPLTIRAGSQKLIVRQGRFQFETESFQLRRQGEVVLKVELLAGEFVVLKDGKPFGPRVRPQGAGPAVVSAANDGKQPSEYFASLGDLQAIVRKTLTDEGLTMRDPSAPSDVTPSGPRRELYLKAEVNGEENLQSRMFTGLSSKLKGLAQASDAFVGSVSQSRQGAIDRYHMTYSTPTREGAIQLERALLGADKRMPAVRTWTLIVRVEEWPKASEPSLVPLTIGMNDEFGMLFEGRLVAPAELSRVLREALKENPDRVVAIDLPKNKWTVAGHVDQLEQIARIAGAKRITRPAWSEIRIRFGVINGSAQYLDINGPGYSASGFAQTYLPNLREVIAKNPSLPVLLDVDEGVDLADAKIAEGFDEVRRVVEATGAEVRVSRRLSQSVRPKAGEKDASLTEERVKELVSEAAGIPNDDWAKLASGTEAPSPDTLESQTLSLMLFSLRALPPAGNESELPAIANLKKDFQYLPEHTPKPAEIAGALWISRTNGYASYIQPEYVTEVTVNVTGDTASGEVAFEKEGLYRGRVRYVARRVNGDWRIEEFHLPNVGLSLQLSEPGVWKRLIRAQSGDDSP